MADPSAHDGIGDLWNQKAIHYLVVFTCQDGDFELIGVGPTLPYTTLDEAEKHTIADKIPEFYVKCPAVAGRLQPKLAPSPRSVTNPPAPMVNPAATPTLKARTAAPFARPTINLRPKPTPESTEPGPGSASPGAGSGEQKAGGGESKAGSRECRAETRNSKPKTRNQTFRFLPCRPRAGHSPARTGTCRFICRPQNPRRLPARPRNRPRRHRGAPPSSHAQILVAVIYSPGWNFAFALLLGSSSLRSP